MPLYDPFDAFGYSASDASFEDTINWETTSYQPSVDFTSGVLQTVPSSAGGQQSFGGGLLGSVKGLFGFADSGLDLLDGLDLKARRVTGEGFLPDDRYYNYQGFLQSGLTTSPLVLIGGALLLVMLLRK